MKMLKNILLIVTLTLCNLIAAQSLTYSFGTPITNSVVPYGTGPWLIVQLVEVEDYTKIIMDANLTSGEFVSKVGFSLNTTVDYDTLIFEPSNILSDTIPIPYITFEEDGFNGGGGNKFDMVIQFETRNDSRFELNDNFTFILNAPISTFNNFGNQLPTFIHVQGIGNNSTWLAPSVPEPQTIGFGIIGALLILRRRRNA